MAGQNSSSAIPILRQVSQPSASANCWSCGDMRQTHFCKACGKVQPPSPTDYFSFFGLPRLLNVDSAQLETEFYQLSRKLHPDVHANVTSTEQEWSLQKSSQLNDAYRTLRDPISRTEYLLKLEGVQLEEQSKAATEQARESGVQKKQVVPPELLEEVFELNMQLEEARMNKKMGEADAELLSELNGTKSSLEQKLAGMQDELKKDWDHWDALITKDNSATDDQRKPIRDRMVDLLNRRNYIRNLVRDVNEVLED